MKLASICVYCGSSAGNDPEIINQARLLGATLAKKDMTLVYGAAKIGVMGAVAQGALDANGKVIGVIPAFLQIKEVVHTGLTELIVNETMHERKMKLQELSDGFITLPGGFSALKNMVDKGFLKQENYDILLVDTTIDGLLDQMENFEPMAMPKWLKSSLEAKK